MKRIISIFLVFILAFTGFNVNQASAAGFKDTPETYGFHDEIIFLTNKDIITGYTDNTFRPEETVTRAAAAMMIGRYLDLDGEKRVTVFKDVGASSVASGYIQSAVDAKVITGFTDGTFRPNETVTRGQLAIFLTRAFKLEKSATVTFTDVSASMTAYPYIQKLLGANITAGYDDNTYRPNIGVTRAQFSAFMARAIDPSFIPEPEKKVQVHYIDVGQGDSTLIQTPDGANILIDGGTKSAGENVVNFLKQKDVGKLDLVVGTHPHSDHIGGLIPVLSAFKVEKFVDSGKAHTSQTYLELLTLIDNKNIPFEVAKTGNVYTYDNGFKMTVLNALPSASNINNASVVLKAEYNKVSFMLTGDAEKEIENILVNGNFNLSSTIYKAGHHGSNTSSTAAFLNEVKPSATILSYGENNSYGHPNADVVSRLHGIGSKLYSTADSGNISVVTNGKTYSVSAKAWAPPIVKPEPKPEPTPTPTPKPQPKPQPSKPDLSSGTYVIPGAPTTFQNCTAMKKYYPYGVRSSHPAYASKHDRDKDGWACE